MNWIMERFIGFNNQTAFVINDQDFSYNDLLQKIKFWQAMLRLHHLPEGAVVSIEGENSLSLMGLIFALYLNKNIIVPINVDADTKRKEYQQISGVEFEINLHIDEKFTRTEIPQLKSELYTTLSQRSHSGMVLFSSGTTGTPKAIVLDFSKMLEKLRGVNKPSRTLSFLTYDHIGGLNTILHTLCSGGCVIFPSDRKVLTVLNTIEKWRVEVLPTTPTFINMLLLSNHIEKFVLSSLRLITYGTEVMPSVTLKRISDKLPNVTFKQTYGLSEVGILSTKSKNNNELWLKLGGDGFDYKIIDNILWIKSDYAMLGYLNAEAPFDDQGYFNTQDIVEVEGEYLRILGRHSEIINIAGEKVYPAEIEGLLSQLPDVLDIVVFGVKNPVTGNGIKALIKHSTDITADAIKKRLVEYAKLHLEAYKRPLMYSFTTEDLHSSRFKKMRNLN